MTMQIPAQPNPGSDAETMPAKKTPVKKAAAKKATADNTTGTKPPVKKAVAKTGAKKTVGTRPVRPAPVAPAATVSSTPEVEEWPPREWRETTRSAGHRQALYVTLAMLAMFAVLVFVAIWGSKNG
jgi:hypothetical protein